MNTFGLSDPVTVLEAKLTVGLIRKTLRALTKYSDGVSGVYSDLCRACRIKVGSDHPVEQRQSFLDQLLPHVDRQCCLSSSKRLHRSNSNRLLDGGVDFAQRTE